MLRDRDARGFLTSMLQREEPEIREPCNIAVGRVDAEHAAHQATTPIRTKPREPRRLTLLGLQARIAAPRCESYSAGSSTSASRSPLQAAASASAASIPVTPTSWQRLRCGAAFQRKRINAASAM